MEKDLTFKQKLFIKHYMTNGYNATKAYMSAYPDSSYDSARSSAPDLLANPNIKEYLKKEQDEVADALLITKEKLVIKLLEIINSDSARNSDKVSATKLLGEMSGFKDVKGISVTFDTKSLSDLLNFGEGE
jgi:phage terminase small subunit